MDWSQGCLSVHGPWYGGASLCVWWCCHSLVHRTSKLNFLASLIPDTNPVFEAWGTGTLAFIGANRYSGGWAWNDGNPWQYMRWGPLQPSNDASEKILTMSSGGYFYDDPPTPPYVWGFICQYERTRFQIYLSISFVITSYILKYLLQGITCSQGKYFGFYSNMGPRIQVVCRDIHRFIWE